MIELFQEGVRKMIMAMNILEDVPDINDFYDDEVVEACNALDDALAHWKDALEECQRIEDTVPRDTQEDNMDEITFTQEEAEDKRRFISEMHSQGIINIWNFCSMKDYIIAHTEKELTFPCPGCGIALEEMHRNIWECPNSQCSIFRIMKNSDHTKRMFSEALNKGALNG